MTRIIIDLCGGSGSWSNPYSECGRDYDVRVVTLPDHDVRTYEPPENVYGVLAAPPCTEFSVVRRGKVEANHGPRNLERGMEIVRHCQRIIEQAKPIWWAMENPRGHLRDFLGRPPLTFQPWQYGDPWTKCTDIWGNYKIPAPIYKTWEDVPKNEKLYIRKPRKKPNMVWFHKSSYDLIPAYHGLPRPTTDAAFRAMTPQGFAKAFFEVNR